MNCPDKASNSFSLRIGYLVSRSDATPWIHALLERISAIPGCEVVTIPVAPSATAVSIKNANENLCRLYRFYSLLDKKREAQFYRSRRLRDEVTNNSIARGSHTSGLNGRHSEEDPTLDSAAVAELNLDLILNLSGTTTAPELSGKLPYGIWYFDHLPPTGATGAVGFWEVFRNRPTSEVSLLVASGSGAPERTLYRAQIRTHSTSPHVNAIKLEYAGIALVEYAIHSLRADKPSSAAFQGRLQPLAHTQLEPPSSWAMCRFLISNALQTLKGKLLDEGRVDQWTFGLVAASPSSVNTQTLRHVRWYQPEAESFVADPFPLEHNGRLYIFVEDFLYRRKRGHIAVIEVADDGSYSRPQPVLERDCHLSFPFVLRDDNRLYLLPEQSTTRSVCLYECSSFPDSWETRRVLLNDFPGVDNVLFRHDGLWWLFSSYGEYGNQDNNLQLFFSESLHGPYTPHPGNPIKLDLRGSRMAGRIIERDGKLYRPAQNCLHRYGGSVILYQITELSRTSYREQELREILPLRSSPFSAGMNTLNFSTLVAEDSAQPKIAGSAVTAVSGLRFIRRREEIEPILTTAELSRELKRGAVLTPASDRSA